MESLLDTLNHLDGVLGVFVTNNKGQLLLYKTHNIYDRALLEQAGRNITKTIESVQLQYKDWETVIATFGEGKLVVRNLGQAILVMIADARLNMPFATVAVRVSTAKLKEAIQRGELNVNQAVAEAAAAPPPTFSPAPAAPPPRAASGGGAAAQMSSSSPTGLVWASSSSSGVEARIAVVDDTCSAFLEACANALSRSVGPLSRVFVRDAVRKVCGGSPFASKDAQKVLAELETRILDREGRIAFRKEVVG